MGVAVGAIVYVAVATALGAEPVAIAMALNVVVAAMVTGPEYRVELAVGVVPFVV